MTVILLHPGFDRIHVNSDLCFDLIFQVFKTFLVAVE